MGRVPRIAVGEHLLETTEERAGGVGVHDLEFAVDGVKGHIHPEVTFQPCDGINGNEAWHNEFLLFLG